MTGLDRKIPLGFARRDFVQGLQATKEKSPCPCPKKVVSDSGAYELRLTYVRLTRPSFADAKLAQGKSACRRG